MSPEEKCFLSLRTLPARLNPEQTGWYLNCPVGALRILIAAGILKPLGKPAPNSIKYFSLVELEQLRGDPRFLSRLTDAIQAWHRHKNQRGDEGEDGPSRRGFARSHPICRASKPASPFSARPPGRAATSQGRRAQPTSGNSLRTRDDSSPEAASPDSDPSPSHE